VPHLTARGVRLHYQRRGPDSPPTLVLLHGLLNDNLATWWLSAAPMLSATADVICYDSRGHGLSERPATGYSVDDAVDDLAAVAAELCPGRQVHVVGNSFGGVVGLRAAVRRPDLVATVTLLDTFVPLAGPSSPEDRLVFGPALAALSVRFAGVTPLLQLMKSILRQQEGAPPIGNRKIATLVQQVNGLLFGTSLLDDLTAFAGFTQDDFDGLTCPVHLIFGQESTELASGERLHELIPAATFRVVPDADHLLLLRQPRLTADLISGWIAGHSAVEAAGSARADA
jgi:pimeloyl-ACP methyl ester carboxylesterase